MASQQEIFYVLNSRWPTIKAYGIQVAKTCQGLKRAGAKVRLIVPIRSRHREIAGIDPFVLYGIRDRFRLIRFPSLDFTRIHINNRFLFTIEQVLFAIPVAVYLLFKKGIIYSRDQFILYLLSFSGKKLFWELHRLPEDTRSGVYRRLLSRVAGIMVITEGIRQGLLKRGVPAIKILVVPDGIDLADFDNIVPVKNESGKMYAVYAGQLMEWKGVDTLVGAAQLLDDRIQVVVVGGTPQDIARLKRLDAHSCVQWVGYLPHADALQWIVAADVLVLPNRKDAGISEFYTSPLKMFEYMASGRRIVASDLPSIREILNDSNAILVPPDNSRALGDGIARALSDTGERAAQARRDVEQYSWDMRGTRILNFIHAISY